jgi:hypothetical protein
MKIALQKVDSLPIGEISFRKEFIIRKSQSLISGRRTVLIILLRITLFICISSGYLNLTFSGRIAIARNAKRKFVRVLELVFSIYALEADLSYLFVIKMC